MISHKMTRSNVTLHQITCLNALFHPIYHSRPVKLTFSRIILVSNKKATAPTTTTTTTAAVTQTAREDSKKIFKTLSSHTTQQTTTTPTGTGTGTGTNSTDNNSNSKDVHPSVLTPHTLSPIYSASMSEYASQASSKNGSPRGFKKKGGVGVASGLRVEVDAATHESTDTADDHLPRRYTIRYDTIRYDTIRYDTIQYDTIRC